MKNFKFSRTFAIVIVILSMSISACSSFGHHSNKWRIEVSEGAKSSGNIIFRVSPIGGDDVIVDVGIQQGTGENEIARQIRNGFAQTLSHDAYSFETDDGEDVLVKKRSGAANFHIDLIENTVKSVRINIDRE